MAKYPATIQLRLSLGQRERLDEVAQQLGVNAGEVVRRCIDGELFIPDAGEAVADQAQLASALGARLSVSEGRG